jgi:hypothetical protein
MQHYIHTPSQHTFVTHRDRHYNRSILPTLWMRVIHCSTEAKSTTLSPIHRQFMGCKSFRNFKQCCALERYKHIIWKHIRPLTETRHFISCLVCCHRWEHGSGCVYCKRYIWFVLQTQRKDIIPHVYFLTCYSYFFHAVAQDSRT